MIYSIFLSNSASGILLRNLEFKDLIDGKEDLASGFLSAMGFCLSEIMSTAKDSPIKLEHAGYFIMIQHVKGAKASIGIFSDIEDKKSVLRVADKIQEIIIANSGLFLSFRGKVNSFMDLDELIIDVVDHINNPKWFRFLARNRLKASI